MREIFPRSACCRKGRHDTHAVRIANAGRVTRFEPRHANNELVPLSVGETPTKARTVSRRGWRRRWKWGRIRERRRRQHEGGLPLHERRRRSRACGALEGITLSVREGGRAALQDAVLDASRAALRSEMDKLWLARCQGAQLVVHLRARAVHRRDEHESVFRQLHARSEARANRSERRLWRRFKLRYCSFEQDACSLKMSAAFLQDVSSVKDWRRRERLWRRRRWRRRWQGRAVQVCGDLKGRAHLHLVLGPSGQCAQRSVADCTVILCTLWLVLHARRPTGRGSGWQRGGGSRCLWAAAAVCRHGLGATAQRAQQDRSDSPRGW